MKRATIQKGKTGYSFTKLQQKAKDQLRIMLKKYPFSEIEKGIFIKFNWVIWKAENP